MLHGRRVLAVADHPLAPSLEYNGSPALGPILGDTLRYCIFLLRLCNSQFFTNGTVNVPISASHLLSTLVEVEQHARKAVTRPSTHDMVYSTFAHGLVTAFEAT